MEGQGRALDFRITPDAASPLQRCAGSSSLLLLLAAPAASQAPLLELPDTPGLREAHRATIARLHTMNTPRVLALGPNGAFGLAGGQPRRDAGDCALTPGLAEVAMAIAPTAHGDAGGSLQARQIPDLRALVAATRSADARLGIVNLREDPPDNAAEE